MLTLTEGLDDQGEVEESEEDDVEFIEAGEDAAETFESTEESLDLVAFAIHGFIVLPGLQAIAFGRNDGNEAKVQSQLESFVVLVGAVHQQMQWRGQRSNAAQQYAAFHRVGGLASREGKGYGRSSIRGNHMNLGGPSAARFSNGLRTVFLERRCRRDAL